MLASLVNLLFLILNNVSITTNNEFNSISPKGICMYNFKKIEEMVNYVKLKNNFIIRAENLGLLNFVFVFFFSINTAKISNMCIAPLKVILNDFFQAMY